MFRENNNTRIVRTTKNKTIKDDSMAAIWKQIRKDMPAEVKQWIDSHEEFNINYQSDPLAFVP